MLIFDWATYKPITYDKYTYPRWANTVGWLISIAVVMAIPVVAFINIRKARGESFMAKVVSYILTSFLISHHWIKV